MKKGRFIITIDGPSGSGKSATAELVATKLGFKVLYTGKIYRFFAKKIIENNLDLKNIDLLCKFLINIKEIQYSPDLDNEEMGKIASTISQHKEIRAIADKFQYDFLKSNPRSVIEGRDIGTVICPDAELKIFLISTPEVRAERRKTQLENFDLSTIIEQIKERDKQDTNREISPLRPAKDALTIDNSKMTLNEVVDIIANTAKSDHNF